ncbi:MAG: Cys-tRNA(Pro) deacylase [Burkholderiales bacterium]|nr:MAG: Cys-tRNA(Pro) deacylase [Betaproteobacteria bacterium]TAG84430.1 MAG: Cys-tRNA(Pro) deacylase [Burkholderiales bacterium]
MSTPDYPITPAIRVLREHKIAFTAHLYDYVEHGGTAHSAASLGVDEHIVVKTIVLEDEKKRPLICLQHGDRDVSTKNLARTINVKTISPCAPDVANRHTGYLVGGTSPFGTRKAIPIYVERSILSLPKIYINGGKRGFLVGIAPESLSRVLSAVAVDAATA